MSEQHPQCEITIYKIFVQAEVCTPSYNWIHGCVHNECESHTVSCSNVIVIQLLSMDLFRLTTNKNHLLL